MGVGAPICRRIFVFQLDYSNIFHRFQVILQKNKGMTPVMPLLFGAGDEARTRYLHLGKVALYQMSYARGTKRILPDDPLFVKMKF